MNVEDIILCFFKVLYPDVIPTKSQAQQVYKEAKELLSKGWTISNITNRIVSCDINNIRNIKSLCDIPYFRSIPPLLLKDNLLKNRFYYHHRLHKTPESSVIEITLDGKIVKRTHPFYLEIVEIFTLNDLSEYFHDRLKIDDKRIQKANRATLKELLPLYGLDLILFTIDEIANRSTLEGWTTKVAETIVYHIDKGQEKLNDVKNVSSGKIVPYYKAYLRLREEESKKYEKCV